MADGQDSAWKNRALGPHAHRNTARQAMDGLWTEARGQQTQSNDPATTSTSSMRQLLGAADTQTAHPATFSTAPTHQLLGSANAETTPARAPAATGGVRRNFRGKFSGFKLVPNFPPEIFGATRASSLLKVGQVPLYHHTQGTKLWGCRNFPRRIPPPPLVGGCICGERQHGGFYITTPPLFRWPKF